MMLTRLCEYGISTALLLSLLSCGGGDDAAPPPPPVTIGGIISGLSGTVVLANNGGDNLNRNGNGAFVFPTPINSGSTYNVTVLTQPIGQACNVSNGSGTANSDVTNVSVTCADTVVTEVEPNDSRATGQIVTRPVTLQGSASEFDLGENASVGKFPSVSIGKVEDWYRFTLTDTTTVTITLTFSLSTMPIDLDLFLMQGDTLLGSSVGLNGTEIITRSLAAGTYEIGVQAFDTPAAIPYTLSIQ